MSKIKPSEWDTLATWLNTNACDCIPMLGDGKELKSLIAKQQSQELIALNDKIKDLEKDLAHLKSKRDEL